VTEGPPGRTSVSPVRLHGWPTIFAGTAFTTFAAGSLLLLVPPLLNRRGLSEATIGLVVACGGIASFLVRIPAGLAYRPSAAGVVIWACGLVTVASLLALPEVGATLVTAALIAVNGAAFAVVSTVAMAAVVEHRPSTVSLGSLMGWFTGSIGAGYSVAAFVAGALGDAIGLAAAIRLTAVLPVLAAAMLSLGLHRVGPARATEAPGKRIDRHVRPTEWLRSMPAGLWMAFIVALYINLVNGALNAFFPLYGLSIGLTLTQIGVIGGIHGTLASVVRFGADALFARIGYLRLIAALVATIAGGVALLALPTSAVLLASIFGVIGLARGILRVASGALAVEGSTGRTHGGASGIYLSGLDLGNVLGPIMGGTAAELFGLRAAFPAIGASFVVVFGILALGARLRSRAAR